MQRDIFRFWIIKPCPISQFLRVTQMWNRWSSSQSLTDLPVRCIMWCSLICWGGERMPRMIRKQIYIESARIMFKKTGGDLVLQKLKSYVGHWSPDTSVRLSIRDLNRGTRKAFIINAWQRSSPWGRQWKREDTYEERLMRYAIEWWLIQTYYLRLWRGEPSKQTQALAYWPPGSQWLGVLTSQVLVNSSSMQQGDLDPHSQPKSLWLYSKLRFVMVILDISGPIVLEAVRGSDLPDVLLDAQIWASAKMNQISVVFSEDFGPRVIIEGIRFVNPFETNFKIETWLTGPRTT